MITGSCPRANRLGTGLLGLVLGLLGGAIPALAQSDGPPNPIVQAQKLYRDGRADQEAGRPDQARRKFQEAIHLDPTYADPWYATAATYLPFRPDAAISAVSDGFKAEFRTFRGQHRVLMNGSLMLLLMLSGALVGTAGIITLRGLRHFQHPIAELFRRRLPALAAAIAAWIIVIQPALWGLGLFWTMAIALGLLWEYHSRGERRIVIATLLISLVVPVSFHFLSRVAAPLNPESNAYLLSAASESPDLPNLKDALSRVSQANPDDPGPRMAMGLIAERTSDWTTAESEYRRALELDGSKARLHNNLGNVLAQTGRLDEAVDEYRKSVDSDPKLAAPHFNLSQAYARRLQFDLVDSEMKKATDLDFDGMRSAIANTVDGRKALISLGLSSEELWQATFDQPASFRLGLPRAMAFLYDGALNLLPVGTLVLFLLGLVVGRRVHRFLPTYACAHCGNVVCRKCLRRIRKHAYCASCGDTILSLKSTEFTRMLLDRRLNEDRGLKQMATLALKVMIPGWEAVRRGRPIIGFGLMAAFMALLSPVLMRGLPVKSVPSLPDMPGATLLIYFATGMLALYGATVLILRVLPEPESALMRPELGMVPGRSHPMDRAA